jgi:hypothetical protein
MGVRRRDHRAGADPRPDHRRRGHRDQRAARAPAEPWLRVWPGLPLRTSGRCRGHAALPAERRLAAPDRHRRSDEHDVQCGGDGRRLFGSRAVRCSSCTAS